MPLFAAPGENIKEEIKSMPGNYHLSVDLLVKEAKEIYRLGIPAVLLFGIPKKKDEFANESYDREGAIQQAVRAIKKSVPELLIITDCCLCAYTTHGHCGIVRNEKGKSKKIKVDNDLTLQILNKVALSHAEAGADMVAPSDMMDGRVAAIRKTLDNEGYPDMPIMSYAAKYASAFYGPFRDAQGSAPQFGDRKSYQMDTSNIKEALREVALDIKEGADIVMVKPALAYLDVIGKIKEKFNHPLAAYSVSGEFSMIKAAAEKGWLDEKKVMMEILTAIKRAGADVIITYFAKEAAKILNDK
jgi:porphobilinogen synthase